MGFLAGFGEGMSEYADILGKKREQDFLAMQQEIAHQRAINLENLRASNTNLAYEKQAELQKRGEVETRGYAETQREVGMLGGRRITKAEFDAMSPEEKTKVKGFEDAELDLYERKTGIESTAREGEAIRAEGRAERAEGRGDQRALSRYEEQKKIDLKYELEIQSAAVRAESRAEGREVRADQRALSRYEAQKKIDLKYEQEVQKQKFAEIDGMEILDEKGNKVGLDNDTKEILKIGVVAGPAVASALASNLSKTGKLPTPKPEILKMAEEDLMSVDGAEKRKAADPIRWLKEVRQAALVLDGISDGSEDTAVKLMDLELKIRRGEISEEEFQANVSRGRFTEAQIELLESAFGAPAETPLLSSMILKGLGADFESIPGVGRVIKDVKKQRGMLGTSSDDRAPLYNK